MSEKESVKLIEVFNSWQGEGPDSGKAMIILRFKTCNLNCPWCDTRVKMRITPEAEYPLEQLQGIINETGAGLLVTGGEPTVAKHFDECVALLNDLEYPVANVESNGFNLPGLIERVDPDKPVTFIYSPKIFKHSDYQDAVHQAMVLFEMSDKVVIKLVYEPDNEDMIDFMNWLATPSDPQLHITIPGQRVYLMPEGTTRATLIQNSEKVFDAAEKYRFNFSSRDHIIYGFV